MKKSMQIFAVVGPLGVGKTTFVMNVIKWLRACGYPTKEHVAYVVNDEGAFIDGELARKSTEVVAMTSGCFTCSDVAELRNTLERLEQAGVRWVFLEGFGITAGNETKDFLSSAPYPFHIFCLLSQRHYVQDIVRYADVVRSQVQAATIGVGVTKYEDVVGLSNHDGILDLVGKERPGIPLVYVADTTDIPELVRDIFIPRVGRVFRKIVSRGEHSHHKHVHHAHCGCEHHDHKHLIHDMYPYSFELRAEVAMDDLRRIFTKKDFVLRVKGAIAGYLFNEIHGDWRVTVEDSRNFVTFYATREVSLEEDLPGLIDCVVGVQDNLGEEQGYQRLRKELVSREETVSAIEELLLLIPIEPIVLSTAKGLRIITHPEVLQLVKEISRRPYVKDEWFSKVLRRCVEYWVRCAQFITAHRDEVAAEDLPVNLRELGVSMSWWVNRYADQFPHLLVDAVERLSPGTMVAQGILELSELNSDPERARWQQSEFVEALHYGLSHGDDSVLILKACQHCLFLARTSELKELWSQSVSEIEEKITQQSY